MQRRVAHDGLRAVDGGLPRRRGRPGRPRPGPARRPGSPSSPRAMGVGRRGGGALRRGGGARGRGGVRGAARRWPTCAAARHWVTPEFEPRRYDTWILAAGMPPGQEAPARRPSRTTARGCVPRDLLDRHAAGEVRMLPPTVVSLEQLAAFDDAAAPSSPTGRGWRGCFRCSSSAPTAPSSCAPCCPDRASARPASRRAGAVRPTGSRAQTEAPLRGRRGCRTGHCRLLCHRALARSVPGSRRGGVGRGTAVPAPHARTAAPSAPTAGSPMTSSKGNRRVDQPNTASSVCRRQSLRRPRRVPWCSNPSASTASVRSSLPRSTTAKRPGLGDLELWGERRTPSTGQGTQHRLERVGCSTVGVLRDEPGGDGSPCPAGAPQPLAAPRATTAPLRRAESATASASSNGSTRAQSRTVRNGGVTPRATTAAGRSAQCTTSPSRSSRRRCLLRRTVTHAAIRHVLTSSRGPRRR